MNSSPVGYMLEVQLLEYLFETPEQYALDEVKASKSKVWGLFTQPQEGCAITPVVYHGWCWLMPKYSHSTQGECPPGFTPLYQGPLIRDNTPPRPSVVAPKGRQAMFF